ncbi:coiled-coil domain-containing protein 50-like isoform X2 [Panonychus citri]|uniref:coiled-coil domain-containing protein 50-like isoform X2 n=1 Tax=Panonychus citri TaxID=50023 RepID=UPI002307C85E|nr:coiled-coil domain-containing protein 50-like isoform X2 [Panonychus citri]
MAHAGLTEEDIPEGKVNQVCREWLVREDNAIAYRLQDEEINSFYEGNRFKNQVFRSDLEKARYIQEKEEYERMIEFERERQRVADEDERIAKEIQEALVDEERRKAEQLNLIVEEDEKLAQRLQEKEKERLKRKKVQRERLQVEKIRLEKFGSMNPDLLDAVNRTIADMDDAEIFGDLVNPIAGTSNSSGLTEDYLSDLCLKPPVGLTEAEMSQFMAEQDEELARFLHQYETQRKAAIAKEKKEWIEAQDYEIARILQEEEKARAKRARERARQAKLERERMRKVDQEGNLIFNGKINQHDDATSLGSNTIKSSNSSGHYYSRERIDSTNHKRSRQLGGRGGLTQSYHELAIEETSLTNMNHSSCSINNNETNYHDISPEANDLAKRDLPPIPSFHNVAMDLDPTYKRRQPTSGTPSKKVEPENVADLTGVHFAELCRVSPCSSSSQSPPANKNNAQQQQQQQQQPTINETNYNNLQAEQFDDNNYIGYQPVQGQRRVTAEKRSKKSRDTCRTQ